MPFVPIAIYAALKYLAYAGWCALLPDAGPDSGPGGGPGPGPGPWPGPRPWWRRAFGLGLIRLGVGVAVGGIVAVAGAHLAFGTRAPVAFVALLVPVRWLEWCLVATIGLGLPLLPQFLLVGPTGRARAWALGGMLVSFATDVLAVLALGSMRALVC